MEATATDLYNLAVVLVNLGYVVVGVLVVSCALALLLLGVHVVGRLTA